MCKSKLRAREDGDVTAQADALNPDRVRQKARMTYTADSTSESRLHFEVAAWFDLEEEEGAWLHFTFVLKAIKTSVPAGKAIYQL